MKLIASRENPLYKRLQRLAGSSRERRKSGTALLDGIHLIEAYRLYCGVPDTVVLCQGAEEDPEVAALLTAMPQVDPVVFATALFNDVAQVATPTGILAICAVPKSARPARPPERCVLLEGIQDPGNLGSILRSSAAAGIHDVFLATNCAFAWSPKTLRAGMGAHFALAIHEHVDLAETAAWFGGEVIATLPRAPSSLYDADLSGRAAWLFGGEGGGLSQEAVALATSTVSIPMAKNSESLNVAAAAAVCFFEQLRQRQR